MKENEFFFNFLRWNISLFIYTSIKFKKKITFLESKF